MEVTDEQNIESVQENLQLIREIGGWTIPEFGKLIGVSNQTIRNLENGKTEKNENYKMSKTQYLAIRTVLEDAIVLKEDNETLSCIYTLFYKDNSLSSKEKEKAITWFYGISKKKKVSKEMLEDGICALLGSVAIVTAAIAIATKLKK